MPLARAGRLRLNLEFFVVAEDFHDGTDAPALRVTMLPGRDYELHGDDAATLRDRLDEEIPEPPGYVYATPRPASSASGAGVARVEGSQAE